MGRYNNNGTNGCEWEKNSMKSLSNMRTVSFLFDTYCCAMRLEITDFGVCGNAGLCCVPSTGELPDAL